MALRAVEGATEGLREAPLTRRIKAHIAIGSLGFLLAVLVVVSTAYGAGELDTTFDTDGKVLTDFGALDAGSDVAIQDDGKIVVVGTTRAGGSPDFALARYNPDGSLDPSFDGDGKVVTDFFVESTDVAQAVAIQGDGKIVVAGGVYSRLFALARYNPDGSLDPSFHGDGKRSLTSFGRAFDVAIQGNGKIVAAGQPRSGHGEDFHLARFKPSGYLDTSFDGDGKVETDFGGSDLAFAMAIQDNGKIVLGGTSDAFHSLRDFALARYNLDGSLDTGFHFDGKQTTDFFHRDDRSGLSLAIQPNGKIVAAGSTFRQSGDNFALARYNRDGSPDASFDGDGKVTTDLGGYDFLGGLAIQADGKLVAAGWSNSSGSFDFVLARYTPGGSLDPGFDGDGKVVTDLGSDDVVSALAIQDDGKLLAAGSSNAGGSSDFALARYLDGPPGG
jgi:uncharacterized delta-60 repeat protein